MIVDILPVFLFVALGYGFKFFKHDISEHLVEFVIYFSLPALALVQIRKIDFNEAIIDVIVISYIAMFLAAVLSFFIGKMLKLDRNTLATFMIVSIFGNTAFVGFSYVESLYSKDELVYALVYDQIGGFVALLTLGMILIAWGSDKKQKSSFLQKIKILLSPPLQAIIFAVLLRDVAFPSYVDNVLIKLEATLIPLVTMIVGMKLEIKAFRIYFKESVAAIGIKMVLVPLLMLAILFPFYDLTQTYIKVTFIEIAMPAMTMATVLAIRGGLNKDLAINVLGMGILASFVIIPLWNFVINI